MLLGAEAAAVFFATYCPGSPWLMSRVSLREHPPHPAVRAAAPPRSLALQARRRPAPAVWRGLRRSLRRHRSRDSRDGDAHAPLSSSDTDRNDRASTLGAMLGVAIGTFIRNQVGAIVAVVAYAFARSCRHSPPCRPSDAICQARRAMPSPGAGCRAPSHPQAQAPPY